jgi:pyridoxine/pyridoxamine 5'-phosphate oxidase
MNPIAWSEDDLEILHAQIWEALAAATTDHAYAWRTPVLASFGLGEPDARTVVLREADPHSRALTCFSDHRTRKVAELHINSVAAWCFYDPVARVQLRARGETRVNINNDLAHRIWREMPQSSRRLYASTPKPGERIALPWEIPFGDRPMDNFAVLVTTIRELDWLHLGEAGHRRARFRWDRDAWEGHWAAP